MQLMNNGSLLANYRLQPCSSVATVSVLFFTIASNLSKIYHDVIVSCHLFDRTIYLETTLFLMLEYILWSIYTKHLTTVEWRGFATG